MNLARPDAAQLSMSSELTSAATTRAEYLCATGAFSHQDFTVSFNDTTYSWVGENLAQTFGTDTFGMFRAFMASPSHRDNILNIRYSEVGIGRSDSCDTTVVLFGGYSS